LGAVVGMEGREGGMLGGLGGFVGKWGIGTGMVGVWERMGVFVGIGAGRCGSVVVESGGEAGRLNGLEVEVGRIGRLLGLGRGRWSWCVSCAICSGWWAYGFGAHGDEERLLGECDMEPAPV
jgi:hypothetical protein